MVNKKIVGTLIVAITLTAIYVSMLGVKIRVDNDKTTFYVKENNRWVVSGREYLKIFDGTKRMYRRVSGIVVDTVIDDVNKKVTITKTTPYIRGPVIKQTYEFDGKIDDPALFPTSHMIEIFNASGKFFRYEVRDLVYSGPSYKLTGETELFFGRNMKLDLEPGYRWARVYKTGIAKAQYDIKTDYEVFNIRFYDPTIVLYLNGSSVNRMYEYGEPINITGTTDTGSVCMSIDAYGYGWNYTCAASTVNVEFTVFANEFKFNDSTTYKNLTSNTTVYMQFDNESINLVDSRWNFTGYYTSDYPSYIGIDIGNDGNNDVFLGGNLTGNNLLIYEFNDSTTRPWVNPQAILYLKVPKNNNVTSAILNLSRDDTYTDLQTVEGGNTTKNIKYEINFTKDASNATKNNQTGNWFTGTDGFFILWDNSGNDDDWTGATVLESDGSFYKKINYTSGDGRRFLTVEYWANYTRMHVRYYIACGTDTLCHVHPAFGGIIKSTNIQYFYSNASGVQSGTTNDVGCGWIGSGGQGIVMTGWDKSYVGFNTSTDAIILHNFRNNTIYGNDPRLKCYDGDNANLVTFASGSSDIGAGNALDYEFDVIIKNATTDYNNIIDPYWVVNASVDTGGDGLVEWNITTGELKTSSETSDLSSGINTYLASCAADKDGNCNVPVVIGSQKNASLQIFDINITIPINVYTFHNLSFISEQIASNVLIPFNITARTWGTLKIDDLNFPYNGSQNITIKAHTPNYATNDTQHAYVVFSNYSVAFPRAFMIEPLFLPATNSSKNVSCWGQDSTTPAYNITGKGYDRDFNLAVRLNQSMDACMNLTVGSSDTTYNISVNTTFQQLYSGISWDESQGLWLKLNLYNCNSSTVYRDWWFEIKSCCDGCMSCW